MNFAAKGIRLCKWTYSFTFYAQFYTLDHIPTVQSYRSRPKTRVFGINPLKITLICVEITTRHFRLMLDLVIFCGKERFRKKFIKYSKNHAQIKRKFLRKFFELIIFKLTMSLFFLILKNIKVNFVGLFSRKSPIKSLKQLSH